MVCGRSSIWPVVNFWFGRWSVSNVLGGRCFAFLLVGGRFLFLRMVGGLWSVAGRWAVVLYYASLETSKAYISKTFNLNGIKCHFL